MIENNSFCSELIQISFLEKLPQSIQILNELVLYYKHYAFSIEFKALHLAQLHKTNLLIFYMDLKRNGIILTPTGVLLLTPTYTVVNISLSLTRVS